MAMNPEDEKKPIAKPSAEDGGFRPEKEVPPYEAEFTLSGGSCCDDGESPEQSIN